MPDGLVFKVGADISQAVAATKTLDKAFDQVGDSAKQMGANVASAAKSVSGIAPSVQKAQQAAVALNNSLKAVRPGGEQATQSLINLSRVAQDAPFGFIGIANNINPLLESFQRLKASTGTTGGALKALAGSLTGAGGLGLAIGVASSLLVVFGDRLFGTKSNAEASEAALKSYKEQVDKVSEAVDGLTSSLAFLNKLGSLNIKIAGLGEVLDLQGQSVGQRNLIYDLQQQRQQLQTVREGILKDETLNAKDRIKSLEDTDAQITALDKKIVDAQDQQRYIFRQIANQRVEDAKKAQDEAKSNYEKYVNDTIAKAKALQSEFPQLFPGIIFSALDTQVQQLNKASKALEEFFTARRGNFQRGNTGIDTGLQVGIKAPPEAEIRPVAQETIDRLNTLFKDSVTVPVVVDFDPTKTQAIKDTLNGIKDTIANGISSSFNTFIDSIARGANAFQSFGQLVGDVVRSIITQLIKAVALAGILSLLSGGSSGGGLSFIKALGQVFGGARASGGPVTSGKAYLVGEKGPEIFRPSASGSIISNNNLGSTGGRAPGIGGGAFIAETRIKAREIVLLIRREMKSQGNSV